MEKNLLNYFLASWNSFPVSINHGKTTLFLSCFVIHCPAKPFFQIDLAWLKTFKFIKAVSDSVFDMINAIYHEKPLIFILYFYLATRKVLISYCLKFSGKYWSWWRKASISTEYYSISKARYFWTYYHLLKLILAMLLLYVLYCCYMQHSPFRSEWSTGIRIII